MKPLLSLKTTLAAILAPCALLAQNSLSGRVLNSVTGAAIAGVEMRLCATSGQRILCGDTNFRATTDQTGAFQITQLPPGQYMPVTLSKEGFAPLQTNASGNYLTAAVSGDSRFDFRMTPYASIRGRIFDPDGIPAPGIAVKLSTLNQKESGTNENGEFQIDSVPPQCCATLSATPKQQAAPADGIQIVTTYYPSVIDSTQALPISVQGTDLNLDIRLQSSWAQAIHGIVLDAGGQPAASGTVELLSVHSAPTSFVRGLPNSLPPRTEGARSVPISKDGTFTFPPIREGEWTLQASRLARPEGATQNEIRHGTATVVISRGNPVASNIDIQLASQFEIEVTADWSGRAPQLAPSFALAAILPVESQLDAELARRPVDPAADESGKPQRIRLLGGKYFIWEGRTTAWAAQPGYYPAAALLNGQDVLGHVVDLHGPATLKMVYKHDGGSLSGTVTNGADAWVILVADPTAAARIGYSAHCDANGLFSLPDLPPGSYTAIAIPTRAYDLQQPAFTTALARDGKRVRIDTRGTTSVELRVSTLTR